MSKTRVKGGLPDFKKIDKKVLKRLLSYIFKNHKLQFTIVFICIILSSVASVSTALFLERLIDDYISPLIGVTNPVFDGLIKAISVMVLIYIVGIIATYVYNRMIAIISQSVLKNIRNEMFEKMQRLPIKYFDTHTYGEIMSYYTNDTDTLREMVSRSIPQFISSTISVITVLCAMIYTSIHLTLMVFIFVAIMLVVTGKIGKKCAGYFVSQQKSIATLNGYVEEMINGQRVIKVFTHEKKAKEQFDLLNEDLCKNATKANQYANILGPILNNIGNLEYAFVGIIGGILASLNIGGLTLGAIASFIGLSKNFLSPISQISQQINSIVMALAGASLIELKGRIEFKNVNFGYEDDKEVLHDISLYAKPGQKIAFVGATGAGKTTITNLLNRFYDISDGEIYYDGIPIKNIKKKDLRKSLGMVLQDVNLFTGSVMDNVKYGKIDASNDDVIKACKLANAHDFIMRLPDGYDTILDGSGENLSQGQKQLISIARALINDPPVMILDEATSNIDTRTEKIVASGMDKLMDGRTVLVIAHRLSTIQNAKAIMVMSHGRIIERGEHDYLISQKGEYYQLYTGALELE